MKEFQYTINDKDGIHARPAGMLVKEASKFDSEIKLHIDNRNGDAKRIFSIMSLGIKYGQSLTVTISGSDEDNAYEAIERFFKENL